ncbi:unnamed protein product [Alopecurus aequalis]
MEEDKEENSTKKLRQDNPSATAASLFTDDLILEILSRLPARSVRRFKCVSTPWRDLIADPVNRKKLPQTLAGFLYSARNRGGGDWSHHFASVSGGAAPVDPSLPFLQPNKYKYIALVDTCHGLLLCSCYNKETNDDFRYVEVFFEGMLHLVGRLNPIRIDQGYVLVVVDMEGKAWKTIRLPVGSGYGTIGLSQGCLYYGSTTRVHVYNSDKKNDVQATKITLWVLENYDSKEWVLKHSASIDDPFGITGFECRVIAFHPDCDTVFLVGRHILASYSMQHQKFVHILNLEKDNLRIFLPYVPLFSEALADADGQ